MQMRTRKAMVENPNLLMGFVEMDETYIGAKKIRKSSKDKDGDGNKTFMQGGKNRVFFYDRFCKNRCFKLRF